MTELFTIEKFLEALPAWYPSIAAILFFTMARLCYVHFLIGFLEAIANRRYFGYIQDFVDAYRSPVNLMLGIMGLYYALNLAPISALNNIIFFERLLRSTIVLCVFWGIFNLSDTTHGFMLKILAHFGIRSDTTVSDIFATIMRIFIVCIAFVAIAKEWNYDITGFLASLSIGSVAIAFAAKDALANVFGSFIIIVEKPFQIGDWVDANGIEGIVEKITFRSTCIRTFPQELVYVPNSLLTNTPITNYTKRERRRLDFVLGLTYSTTRAQMESVIKNIRQHLLAMDMVYKDDIRVHFVNYNSSSLDIKITCYILTGVHTEFLDIVSQLNLELLDIIEQEGVSCAFPSQSVYMETPIKLESPSTEKKAK